MKLRQLMIFGSVSPSAHVLNAAAAGVVSRW
jgi:hypothetical protein